MAEESSQYHFDPATYLEMVTRDIPDYVELQERTARATVGVTVQTILELGIGTGETAVRVLAAHPGAELVGVDESPHMLEHARRRLPNAELLVRRLEEPLPAGGFDLVVSAFAVHHLDGPEKAELFRRIAAALRPGGRFVLTDVVVPEDPSDVVLEIDGVHDRPSRIDEQLAWLEQAGLRSEVVWSARDLAILVADRNAGERARHLAFRRADGGDTDEIVALVESAYRGVSSRAGWTTEADLLDGQRTDLERVRSAIERPESFVLLATDADEIVGCCHLARDGSAGAYFGMFAVRPSLQGGGLGGAVLAEAERIARAEWGAHSMRMTVIRQREDLLAWYERRGYVPTGETEPFPYGDRRFGIPRRDDLEFLVLRKPIG